MAVREALTLKPVKSTKQVTLAIWVDDQVPQPDGIVDIAVDNPVVIGPLGRAIRTLGVGFYEEGGAWDNALFHGQDHLQETRVSSRWLGMANVALDRADEKWLVRRTRLREDGTYTPDFSRVTSLSASAMALQVSCFV